MSPSASDLDIAIVGMAGRFPGARNLEEYWENLSAGTESISFFSDEELMEAGLDREILEDPRCVKARGKIADADRFDAKFFDMTAREAETMDPQLRIFLEQAWHALESAACDPARFEGKIGVYAGASINSYLLNHLHGNPQVEDFMSPQQIRLVNRADTLATRVSYKLGLEGPAFTVQTNCSTSLVAIHLACQSLLGGECSMALAGGVAVHVPQRGAHFYQEGGIASPDGHCRAFDAKAEGTVGGNGVGVVVLKPLMDALADGDPIRAVIKGTAINNDGSRKVGYTAPSIDGQSEVIADALAMARIDPSTVTYVEAHGTGTPLGDPIEVAALTQAFRSATEDTGFCALGSVKTNIGHLDTAAGVAGLIKTVLAMEHRQIPPSLHYENPNPKISFEETPFFVNDRLRDWQPRNGRRRAGVSSFGIGGTNAHVVLEEAPHREPPSSQGDLHTLCLSARSSEAADASVEQLAEWLEANPDAPLGGVARTLHFGRGVFEHRRAVVARDPAGAVEALRGDGPGLLAGVHEGRARPVAFLFSGQGSQYAGMGRELFDAEPVFAREIRRCAEILRPRLDLDLVDLLYPPKDCQETTDRKLRRTEWTQPALFAVEHALGELLASWGVEPAALLGHSLGELVAATRSGVFRLEDALGLVAERGRLMEEMPGGAMLAVGLAADDLTSRLPADLDLAVVNEPQRTVVSGPADAVDAFVEELAAEEVSHRRLHTSHAFHSRMMEPVVEPFVARVRELTLSSPEIPFLSNVTGDWARADQVTDPEYWGRQLRSTVRFADAVDRLRGEGHELMLEVGPGRTLTTLVAKAVAADDGAETVTALPTLPHPKERQRDSRRMARAAVADAWTAGARVDWSRLYGEDDGRRLVLPGYPFERARHWIERPSRNGSTTPAGEAEPGGEPAEQPTAPPVAVDPTAAVLDALREVVHQVAGVDRDEIDETASFFELGLDSLLMMQLVQAVENELGESVPFRRLFEELPTLKALAEHLRDRLPEDRLRELAPAPPEPEPEPEPAPARPSTDENGELRHLVARQTEALEKMTRILEHRFGEAPAPPEPQRRERRTSKPERAAEGREAAGEDDGDDRDKFGPWRPIGGETSDADGLTPLQREHLEELTSRRLESTGGSRRFTAEHRELLADNRVTVGFRPGVKELVYPIVVERSSGSRVWDVDGNEYLDFVMGFGVNLFGHSPDFISRAVAEQAERGIHLGAQVRLAGEVAERIRRLTGVERVAFSNTGSEAVMAAVRMARTATARSKIALFSGSYHGIWDGVLARRDVAGGSRPVALGIPDGMVDEVVVLEYGAPESLETLRSMGRELAAVLVEPVQSARLDLQPADFLRELRAWTSEVGTALLFDEAITGFRIHPGGAQAHFGIEADLVTYSKIVGGGLPMSVIAGKKRFLDTVDGGAWSYGDASYPEANQTFFAGTFAKHPLALAASRAVLERLEERGPELQEELTARGAALARGCREIFDRYDAAVRVRQFGSQVRFAMGREVRFPGLLYYHLVQRGIHLWEGRSLFVSTAHTDEELDTFLEALEDSVRSLRRVGFLGQGVQGEPETLETRELPLTEEQKQLWILVESGGESSRAYNEPSLLRAAGPLVVPALTQGIVQLVERHEALRITFSPDGETQEIHAAVPVDLPVVDLSGISSETASGVVERLSREVAERTFDLVGGPLFRFRLFRLAPRVHRLQRVAHHLIVDGWSAGVLLQDLLASYQAYRNGTPAGLPESRGFGDYVTDQAARREGASMARARDFWLDWFQPPPAPLDLPVDRPRAGRRSYRGGRHESWLDAGSTASLREVAESRNVTLMTVLLRAYQLLLHRLSGSSDLTVGLPAAGQSASENHRLVGYCVRLLPLRSRRTGDPPFSEWMDEYQSRILDALEHQQYSFSRLLQELDVERDPHRPPLLSTLFNLERSGGAPDLGELTLEALPNPSQSSKYELAVSVVETEDRLRVELEYAASLFDETTARRWMAHYRTLLDGLAATPESRISELPLLAPPQRQQVEREWTTADRSPTDGEGSLVTEFARQVARGQDATALSFGDLQVSYGELHRRAMELARRLRSLGVDREERVGLCLSRSPGLIVAVLGTLAAGGAYVPLDPTHPPERLSYMVSDAGVRVVVMDAETEAAAPLPIGGTRLSLESVGGTDEERDSEETWAPPSRGAELAYVIYTSGSTGRPKGVAVTHGNALFHLRRSRELFQTKSPLRVLQIGSLSFDVSVLEIFLALLSGGCLRLVDQETVAAGLLGRELSEAQITTIAGVPAVLDGIAPGPYAALRHVIAGGARVTAPTADRWSRGQQLYNAYGPTEATVFATLWTAPGVVGDAPPIGYPIPGVEAWVLDARNEPVPPGAIGHLSLAGPNLARGYLGRPRITAEHFVPHPASSAEGKRLYRTGDLARWLPDGQLDFVGRLDDQVKLRGLRIEPGEIAEVLREHAAVDEALVLLQAPEDGEDRLVAYVAARPEEAPEPGELREHLRAQLPGYMVASHVVVLDAFPRTPSGKVDRDALPDPDRRTDQEASQPVAPRTALEEIVSGVWAALLEIDDVGIHESFFELGGNSLLATRAALRLRDVVDAEVSLETVLANPTVATLATEIETSDRVPAPPLELREADSEAPLSFAQQRLWFLDRMAPGAAYNLPVALRLRGRLNLGTLETTLREIVRRHESLRTVFTTEDGVPRQRVLPVGEWTLPMVDLGGLRPADRSAELTALAAASGARPFDLARGPLFRGVAVRLSGDDHGLLLGQHHIVTDGWSTGILLREMEALYAAWDAGRPSPLAELPLQYADFAAWQRDWLSGEVLEAQREAWRDRLEELPILDLPTDRPRPPVRAQRGAHHRFVLSPGVVETIDAVGRHSGATRFMVLMAAFQLLLGRYAGQTDLPVGTVTSGRSRSRLEDLIGMFVHTLVVRGDLTGEPSFRELLDRVRRWTLWAYAHQEMPFEGLVEEIRPVRDPSRTPLFQVMLVLQNAPRGGAGTLGDVGLEPLDVSGETSKFDLTMVLVPEDGALRGSVEYDRELFDVTTVDRFVRHFQRLAEAVAARPERSVLELPLLSPGERQQVTVEWNHGTVPTPTPSSVADVLAARVSSRPDAVAVVGPRGEHLTYRELARRAAALAGRLRSLGVRPGSVVAICLTRSPREIVSVVAALEAGAAYLPLDPAHPAERLEEILDDAGAELVITEAGGLAGASGPRVLDLDRDAPWTSEAGDLPGSVDWNHLAYVIYTSGSTGRPKGVEISHRGLLHLVAWHREAFAVDSSDRGSRVAGLGFDAAVWELWPYLLSGATVVLPDSEERAQPELLRGVWDRERVTVAFAATPLAEMLLDLDWSSSTALRTLLTGGDRLHRHPPANLPFPLINNYGPTETTVVATSGRVPARRGTGESVPTLGRPIGTVGVHLLDAALHPVPVRVAGEICLAGPSLARGYRRRPRETAAGFVPHPYSRRPGARLYRTGDLARWRPDGEMEFLERMDHQVQVRGFRVELGEIEAALLEQGGVAEAAVVARGEAASQELVAYIVASGGADVPVPTIRQALERRVPSYMVPSRFVRLDALPLTSSGKVDRRALPEPEKEGDRTAETRSRTPLEELVAGIWETVLDVDRVALRESFFEIGGHSLLATRVISRVRELVDVDVPVRTLFESPTLEGFASAVEAARSTGPAARELSPLGPREADGPAPLSFAQRRLWFLDRLEPDSAAYNIWSAPEWEDPPKMAVLEAALGEIVRRHEVLRTRFDASGSEPVQIVMAAPRWQLPVVDLGDLDESDRRPEARRLQRQDRLRRFDLEGDLLLRARWLRGAADGPGESATRRLLLAIHHIAGDGWSMDVLRRELRELVADFAAGRSSRLPELPIQYADYAAWQREELADDLLADQLGWWRERLEGAEPLELPTDRPRPAEKGHRGGWRERFLPAVSFRSLARREGATPFMVAITVFQVLMARLAGQRDVSTGTPIAGRRHRVVEPLIGFFVNTLVLRTKVVGTVTFRDLLSQVRQEALGAFAHSDLPFEKLVDALEPDRDLSRTPLFQVMFSFRNLSAPPQTSDEPREVQSRFDLTLILSSFEDRMKLTVEYDRELFDATTAERLLRHYETLAHEVLEAPERSVAELRLLSPSQRHQIEREWNDTRRMEGRIDLGLAELFDRAALERPEAVAVDAGDAFVTYGELRRRALALAEDLRDRGVTLESRVGVWTERSPEMLVALLAVVYAGAAYVPLDPEYPRGRLEEMVRDAGVSCILGRAEIEESPSGVEWIELGRGLETSAPRNAAIPTAGGLEAAYVMYTSGSTGRPKGVVVPHRAIARLVFGVDYVHLHPECRIVHISNTSFDAATFEIWAALLHGARLLMIDQDVVLSPERFVRELESRGAGILFITTALFHQMTSLDGASFAGLETVLFGGEAIDPQRVLDVLDGSPPRRLHHVYGPTENTTFSTWHPVRDVPENATTVPIGGPLANSRQYVLDPSRCLAAPGTVGELYLGGRGLSRGYWDRPRVTAEHFVPDPFGDAPGSRLYRTGDLVRLLAGSGVSFVGRVDFQVKLRGHRIEPGEIEAVLREDPWVEAALVRVEGERLVAYATRAGDGAVDVPGLLARVRDRLPEYMAPADVVVLDEFPLTPNGKIDRDALPKPRESREDLGGQAPRTPTEELVTQVFGELLDRDGLTVEDDFFELGGHSLMATRLVSRLEEIFDVAVPLREVFAAPRVEELARRIHRLRESDEDRPSPPPVVPRGDDGPAPLSFAQQRLWFLDRLEPNHSAYNIPAVQTLDDTRSSVAQRDAWLEVIRRHEVLRTRFEAVDGEPEQRVDPPRRPALPWIDLRGLGEDRARRELHRSAREALARPFDLRRGPLLRLRGCLFPGGTSHWLLVLHHILGDGWSLDILEGELEALSEAYAEGLPSPLPELSVQYADYAVWQRDWLSGDTLEDELAWWREHLRDQSVLSLPLDRPRPAMQSYRGGWRRRSLEGIDLQASARREGATVFMLVLAVFQALLARHARQRDVSVGTPIAGRRRRELEDLIGFFVNTLVLRVDVDSELTFRELLEQVRDTALAAYSHQDVPFEKVVEAVDPQRDLSRSPLFQVLLTFQDRSGASAPVSTAPPPTEGAAKFDLTLSVTAFSEGLRTALEYNRDLFDDTTAERLLRRFETLLRDAVRHPERRVRELHAWPRAERHQVLREWGDATGGRSRPSLAIESFVAAAERRPDAVALVYGEHHVSYGCLESLSGRLATALVRWGVGPGRRVGLSLPRNEDLIVAQWACLRSGGAYVPLDPSYPSQRLALMMEDAEPHVVLTRTGLPGEGDSQASVRSLSPEAGLADTPEPLPALPVPDAEDLAYVIYTSGSTGRPKGVAIRHGGVAALLEWADRVFPADQLDGVLASTSINFDLSIFEILWPLTRGGRVELVQNALDMGAWSGGRRISLINTVPSILEQMLEDGGDIPLGVRTVNLAGEPLPEPLAEQVHTYDDVEHLYNLYGPSEDTTYSTFARIDPGTGKPRIGRPVDGALACVLDGSMRSQGLGVVGELYLGGAGLARGYWNRPARTAEAFVPSPWGPGSGSRLYRTGDLVRWLPDGDLEFLGRMDHQVKVRGFRIEPGEVESTLRRASGVASAAVVARGESGAERRLVAYVASEPEVTLSPSQLREGLARTLPDYLVPSQFVILESLPLTPNGKVDRKALPAPEDTAGTRRATAPRDDLELELVRLWEEVLDVERVGVHQDFFTLGGTSFHAIRLADRIERRVDREVAIADLFRFPTVASLADALRTEEGGGRELVPLAPEGSRRPFFCVHSLGGSALRFYELARRLDDEQPFYGLQAPPPSGDRPIPSIEDMARRYLDAILEVQPSGPYLLGGYSFGCNVAFEMARQLTARGEHVELLALLDGGSPGLFRRARRDLDKVLIAGLARDAATMAGVDLDLTHETVASLERDELLEHVVHRLREEKLVDSEADMGGFETFFRGAASRVDALRAYRPGPYAGDVQLFVTSEVEEETIRDWRRVGVDVLEDRSKGWADLCTGNLDIVEISGHHATLMSEPTVQELAEALQNAIDTARELSTEEPQYA